MRIFIRRSEGKTSASRKNVLVKFSAKAPTPRYATHNNIFNNDLNSTSLSTP